MPRTHRSLWLCTFLVGLAVATLALPPPATRESGSPLA